ncbi:anti-sigma factor [Neolewinella agarilytica]|uniref:Zinc-finger n=1 Tax=Neolewinella agarilytica TaxID=478744 RepID=A0A1H9IBH2_9BACT|nr:hypothetical protein [Neolewinella agarilytica]SEQ71882.1 hypothetical protein SAMN05444359_114125 [Neolewinella agarilytica]
MKILLVAVVAAAIIYYIGREVLSSFAHVSDEDLLAFWRGKLPKQDRKAFRRISDHLGRCEACRDRLDAIRKNDAGPGVEAPYLERKY